jgi:hypothetical protein
MGYRFPIGYNYIVFICTYAHSPVNGLQVPHWVQLHSVLHPWPPAPPAHCLSQSLPVYPEVQLQNPSIGEHVALFWHAQTPWHPRPNVPSSQSFSHLIKTFDVSKKRLKQKVIRNILVEVYPQVSQAKSVVRNIHFNISWYKLYITGVAYSWSIPLLNRSACLDCLTRKGWPRRHYILKTFSELCLRVCLCFGGTYAPLSCVTRLTFTYASHVITCCTMHTVYAYLCTLVSIGSLRTLLVTYVSLNNSQKENVRN